MIIFVLAIYNEERNLPTLISNIRKKMAGKRYKILAIDDGSLDRSRKILEKMAGEDLVLISHKVNLSIGAVFSTGFNSAHQMSNKDDDIIVLMESDNTSSLELVDAMVDKILKGGKDVVVASRYIGEGRYRKFPFMRLVYSKSANAIMRFLFPLPKINDYTIFFRAYRASLLDKVIAFFGPYNLFQSKGFVSNIEMLVKMSFFTDKFDEVPFIYNYGNKKGRSKLNVLSTMIEYATFVFYMRDLQKKMARSARLRKSAGA